MSDDATRHAYYVRLDPKPPDRPKARWWGKHGWTEDREQALAFCHRIAATAVLNGKRAEAVIEEPARDDRLYRVEALDPDGNNVIIGYSEQYPTHLTIAVNRSADFCQPSTFDPAKNYGARPL